MKTIVLTHRAAKELDALPAEDRFAVTEALTLYAIEGRGDVKKLAGREGYRLRVRDCRPEHLRDVSGNGLPRELERRERPVDGLAADQIEHEPGFLS